MNIKEFVTNTVQRALGKFHEEHPPAGDVLVAEYNVTTAQELLAHLGKASFAPIVVKRGSDYYTAVLSAPRNEESAVVRVIGSSGGEYFLFTYTVTGATWASSSYGLQKKLVSGTDIKTINGQSLLGSGEISVSSSPVLTDSLTVASPHGQASVGTTYPAGTSIENIVRDALAPTLQPTITPPSMTIRRYQEKYIPAFERGGGSVTFNSSDQRIEVSKSKFDRGSINPSYGTNGYRAGEPTNITLNGVLPSSVQGESYYYESVPVTESNNIVKAKVYHIGGEQPKDSGGNDYDSPFTEPVESNGLIIEFNYCWWSNLDGTGSVTKMQAFSKKGDDYGVDSAMKFFEFLQGKAPYIVDVPPDYNIIPNRIYNSTLREYITDQFVVSSVVHQDAAGNNVTYTRYTKSDNFDQQCRIMFEWSL